MLLHQETHNLRFDMISSEMKYSISRQIDLLIHIEPIILDQCLDNVDDFILFLFNNL